MRIDRLIKAFDSNPVKRDKAVKTLIALKDQRSIEPLLMVLGNENKDIRRAAMEVLVALGETKWERVIEGNLNDFTKLGKSKDPRIFDVLVKALGNNNYEIRCATVRGLAESGYPGTAAQLISILKDENKYVMAAAAEALGQLKDQCAVEPLIKVLVYNTEENVMAAAAEALGQLKDQRAVEPLVNALGYSSPRVCVAAETALNNLNVQWVGKALIGVIENKKFDIRKKSAIQLLGKLKSPLAADSLVGILEDKNDKSITSELRIEAIRVLGELKSPLILNSLISVLEDKSIGSEIRIEAIRALGKINDQRAREPLFKAKDDIFLRNEALKVLEELSDNISAKTLIDTLNDSNVNNRLMAIRALGRSKDPQSVGPLIEIIEKESGNLQLAAVEALGNIKDKMAADSLLQLLKSAENYIKEAIVMALGSIGDKKAVEPLIQVLKDKGINIRLKAIRALGCLEDPKAVEPLIRFIGDSDNEIRVEAAKTLSILGENQWKEAIKGDPDDFKRLVELKDARIFEVIIGSLGAGDEKIRESTAAALGRLKDERAVRPLIKTLNDKTYKVRIKSLKALSVFKDIDAAGPLIKRQVIEPLIGKLKAEDPKKCTETAKELGIIGAKEAVEPLIECFRELESAKNSQKAQEACIEALGMIGDPSAAEFFISIIKDRTILIDLEVLAKAYVKVNGNNDTETLFNILENDIGYWDRDPIVSERRFSRIVKILGELKEPGIIPPLIKLIPRDFFHSILYIMNPKSEQVRIPNYIRYPLFIDAALSITGASLEALKGFNLDKRKRTALLLEELRNEDTIKPITREITDTVQLIYRNYAPGIPSRMEETVSSMRKLEKNLYMIHNALKKANLH